IDVGVNVGQTLIKLRTVSTDTAYIGFEPNPLCVYYASELIKANKYNHTKLLPVGLFSHDGILELNLYSEGDTDQAASVIENFRPNQKVHRKMYVPVSNFENLAKILSADNISIVKIDVEGAELEVLQSLAPTLQSKRPFVLVEILPAYDASNTARITRQQQMEALLKTVGYTIFRVIKKDKNTIQRLEPLTEIGIHGNLDLCEYLLAPEELTSTVSNLF
ncbi:MAG: FkbM family methyltransferase, partial [Bacteroidota bacterium]|nr:FkbM family methyltransferase [Bacteroidota bacterium]